MQFDTDDLLTATEAIAAEPTEDGMPCWFLPVSVTVDGKTYGADVYFDATGGSVEQSDVVDWADGAGIVSQGYATEWQVVQAAMDSGLIVPRWNQVNADQLLAFIEDRDDDDLAELGDAFSKRVKAGPTYFDFAFCGTDDSIEFDKADGLDDMDDPAQDWAQEFCDNSGGGHGDSFDIVIRPRGWSSGPSKTVKAEIAGVREVNFVNGSSCGSGFDVYGYVYGAEAAALIQFKDGSGRDDVYVDLSNLDDMDRVDAVCRNFANGTAPDESEDGAEELWDDLHARFGKQSA